MFRSASLAIVALALSACGSSQPVVTTGDITKYLESLGYTKVLVRDAMSCGTMGNGRRFIATKSAKPVIGQVCYRKEAGKVTYKVDELNGSSPKPISTPTPTSTNTMAGKVDGGASFWNKN